MQYVVYILKSLKDRGYYVGLTGQIEKRVKQHNAGSVCSTKARIPFKLLYTEVFDSRVEAREREKYLKSYKGSKEKLSILENLGDRLMVGQRPLEP